jgi:hypothetical protein
MKENTVKKSLDVQEDLFEAVMQYAYKRKIYKFGPSVIELLEIALSSLTEEKENGDD